MKKLRQVNLIWLVVGIALLGSISAGAQVTNTDTTETFATIQAAIDDSDTLAGHTISVAAGTYAEALNVNKSVTIEGASAADVTINVAGYAGTSSSGIYVAVDAVHLSGFTLKGTKASASPRYGIKYGEVSGGSLDDIVVQDVYRSGFDFLGTSNTTITNIVSQNNGGHGISLCDANNMALSNITVSGNGWQGVSVVTWGRYSPIGTSGIVFSGTNSFVDVFQLEQGRYPTGPPEPITFSTNLADGADVTVQASDFTYTLWGDDDEAPNYQRVYFTATLADAQTVALAYDGVKLGHLEATGRYIQSIADRSQLYVSPGCALQAAVDAANDADTIHVAAGTYNEQLVFAAAADGLTIRGDTGNLPVIDGGVTFVNTAAINGIAFENLYFTGANAAGNKMIKMDSASAPINDFSLDNCVFDGEGVADRIGIYGNKFAGTLSITNCEFKDIHGWAVFDLDGSYGGPPYGGNEFILTSVTFANNHIHDCDGTVAIRGNHAAPTATVDIYGNVVDNIGGNDGGVGDQWAGIEVNHAVVANIYGNTVNDVEMGAWEGQAFQLWDIADLRFGLNVITNNAQGIWIFGGSAVGSYGHWTVPGGIVSLNSIVGNIDYGIGVDPGAISGTLDATANWWGSVDGPTADHDSDGTPEYIGGGDIALGNIIYSPWLGADPDGNPLLPGVQLTQPLYIIVDDIGPEPQAKTIAGYVANSVAGYLNRAIGTANAVSGTDTIEVRHGTYDASEPVTEGATIVSEVGSATHTILNGAMSLDSGNILIGRLGQGFTINGPVTVGIGIDASTIHINWNDIFGVVTNNGTGTLDAIFNYWGEDGPNTVGSVAIYPVLPTFSDTVIGYMDEHGLSALDAIYYADMMGHGSSSRDILAALELAGDFAFSPGELLALIEDYGRSAVSRALRFAGGDYEAFLVRLIGYESGGGGGGGGAATGTGSFCVGCPIPLQLELLHPITGEPITDACVSYSVCRRLDDGTTEIVLLGVMRYDGDFGAYVFDVDTTDFEPGIYDIYLGSDDGRSRHFQVEVAAD